MTDVDGKEYVDLMCGYGPIVLGRQDPTVDDAARRELAKGDVFSGWPSVIVDLCELLVETVAHADWAMLAKNGTDATTSCVSIARAATGRKRILMAYGAYHGSAPWCTPYHGGVIPSDRAELDYFEFNDTVSLKDAVERAGDDLAGIIVCPFRHDYRRELELVDPEFARAVRDECSRTGAVLILDDVRAGFRLDLAGSWEPLGIRPDLSAYSKAIANGYPLSAITGVDALRDAAQDVYVTGSFWYSGVPMAAAVATIQQLRDTDAMSRMELAGTRLREGLASQAVAHGFAITQSGPVQMPLLTFDGDDDFSVGGEWGRLAMKHGVFVNPFHNWFLCAAHTEQDIEDALERTDIAFADLARGVAR